ncbi:MAG TPA: DOMON-like domain-containing protein [Burkholderiales bacterium]|nr:DOMON-like domain-containing protein [Burkholderiales bacterium]
MLHAVLERHPAAPCAALRGIHATVTPERARLKVQFRIEGDIDRLRIPPSRAPRAADRLWQHTCCEVFLAGKGGAAYREFNLSPSGEWAAYEFTRYREGAPFLIPDPGIAVRRNSGGLELEGTVPLSQETQIALSAVIEDADGNLSYWALRHAPGKPDFHHRESFALELGEVRH